MPLGIKLIISGSFSKFFLGMSVMLILEGQILLKIRDKYIPENHWQYFSYHHGPLEGYKVYTLLTDDGYIDYIEVPPNHKGELDRENAIYIDHEKGRIKLNKEETYKYF